jgi:thiol-disulfide isomerase/thioredoxin
MKIVHRWLSFALLTVLLSCGSQSAQISIADIELSKLDGTSTSIGAASKDRPLLVSLWAVWCQPCKRELPVLQDISRQRQDLAILAVNIGDDPEKIESFLSDNDLSISVAIDNNGALLEALDAATVPVTVLFDTNGKVLWSHLGAVSADQVNQALDIYASL